MQARGGQRRLKAGVRGCAAVLLASTMLAGAVHAQTVTWDGSAGDGNWFNNVNWTPGAQPQPGETALFNGATPKAVAITGGFITIDAMRFEPHAAPGYTFNVSFSALTLDGAGIVNTGAPAPTFNLTTGLFSFVNNGTTAGNAIINVGGAGAAVQFLGQSDAGTATIVANAGGTVDFSATASAAGASITTNANAVTQFQNDSTAATSTIVVNGTDGANFGFLSFSDDARAGSAQITANAFGLIQFQDNATTDNATVTVNNNGVAAFIGNAHGGTARFVVNAGGTLDMSFTAGAGGAGRVSVGSLEGAGEVFLPDLGTLAVGGNGQPATFSGTLTECVCGSALEKAGPGTWIFTGTTNHTGATVVSGGTLIVNSSIASSSQLTVDAGGTIGGTGILPQTVINGGSLAPGNSIGTITVQGTLTMTAGAYVVEVSPTAADRTNVATTAALAGTLRLQPTGGTYTVGQQYVILNAPGGRTGEFTTLDVSSGFSATVKPRIVYDNANVILVLDPNALTPLLPPATGGNQHGAAGAIDRIVASGGGDAFAGLFTLPPGALSATLSQLTGEIGTTGPMLWFEAMRQFLNAMTDPFAGLGGGGGPGGFASFAPEQPALPEAAQAFASIGKAPATAERRWTVWGAAFGSQSTADGNPSLGSNNASARNGNIAVGADYRIAPDTRIGFAAAGGSGSFSVSGLGSGRGDTYQLGVYGVTRLYDMYLAAAGSYAWADVSTDRSVNVGGVSGRLTARYNAEAIGGRIEAGRRFAFGAHGVTPFAALLAEAARTPAYSEQVAAGAAAFALSYGGTTAHRTRSELGIGLDTRLALAGVDSLSLFVRVAWAHEFSRDRTVTAAFQALPTASFTVRGASPAADAAVVTGGLEVALARGVALRGKVEGEFADGVSTYSATGALRVSW